MLKTAGISNVLITSLLFLFVGVFCVGMAYSDGKTVFNTRAKLVNSSKIHPENLLFLYNQKVKGDFDFLSSERVENEESLEETDAEEETIDVIPSKPKNSQHSNKTNTLTSSSDTNDPSPKEDTTDKQKSGTTKESETSDGGNESCKTQDETDSTNDGGQSDSSIESEDTSSSDEGSTTNDEEIPPADSDTGEASEENGVEVDLVQVTQMDQVQVITKRRIPHQMTQTILHSNYSRNTRKYPLHRRSSLYFLCRKESINFLFCEWKKRNTP